MADTLKKLSSTKCFSGFVEKYSHTSACLGCDMKFAVYLPPQAASMKCPVIFFLSGLTCTEENFITKAGAQSSAAKHGVILVAPDTSPRGCNIPGDKDSWDFGEGAGFYVDATADPWKKNYRMYSYITEELFNLVKATFPCTDSVSITGHSMGGHGALVCALRNPGKYKSVSAFAPICNPINCPWGKKAFTGYLGTDESAWKAYDSCELVQQYSGPDLHILVDQGDEDGFYSQKQLLTENLQEACKRKGMDACIRIQPGYDHSYYFISTFIDAHISHHAEHLKERLAQGGLA
eukprot:CAMPEP_0177659728 /NCGR_PEP_ID=MMETSP0447-20121125/17608_1 /TAXON_ID=0 /ORGANISM="Stygamoeba regulata, Strain BSH-02190019" /LENGTH=291 /DNA_ID=CAMNT_0019164639 /DNA_START=64 /DNA_END=936 /DNA_ORIENTATION=-